MPGGLAFFGPVSQGNNRASFFFGVIVGWWEDLTGSVRQAVQDVTNAAGETWKAGGQYVIAPQALGFIATGDYLQKNGEATKNFAIGAQQTFSSGGLNILGQQSDIQGLLRDKKLSSLTLGYSDDAANFSSSSGKFLSGGRASQAEEEGAIRFGVKTGALVGIGAAGAAYGAGGSTYGSGYLAAQAASKGDYAGAITRLAGAADVSIPSPLLDLIPRSPTSGGSSRTTTPGFSSTISDPWAGVTQLADQVASAAGVSSTTLLVGVVAAIGVAYVAARKL